MQTNHTPASLPAAPDVADCATVRGFVLGFLLLLFVVFSVLSLRPGGLRNQLRNVARRFKLAMLLAGVYLVASAVLRVLLPNGDTAQWWAAGVGLVLAAIFLLLSQERRLDT